MVRNFSKKSSGEMTSAPAVPISASRNAASKRAAFDGVNRDDYFREE